MVEPAYNIVPVNSGPIFPEDTGPYTTVGSPNDSASAVDTSEFHGIERAHLTYLFPDQKTHLDTTELTYGPGQGLSDQQQNLMALRHKTGLPLPPDIMPDDYGTEKVIEQPNLLVAAGEPSAVYSSNDPVTSEDVSDGE
jgi:hypothetical protein